MMPKSDVRLSAGRTEMSDETHALCFFAGANSIFVGDTLLTAGNPGEDADGLLFAKLGLEPMTLNELALNEMPPKDMAFTASEKSSPEPADAAGQRNVRQS